MQVSAYLITSKLLAFRVCQIGLLDSLQTILV